MGVRDALRMVDSFLRWSKDNKEKAKSLDDFIHDGLVAAAKRCESCLHKELGVKFDSKMDEYEPVDDSTAVDEPEDEELIEYESDTTPPEIVLETEGPADSEEIPIRIESEDREIEFESSSAPAIDDGSVRLESMGMHDGSVEDDTQLSGGPREFSSDFALVEPDPLVIESDSDSSEEEVEDVEESDLYKDSYVPEPPPEVKEELSVERPKYSWEQSEPTSLREATGSDDLQSEEETKEPSESLRVWSPMEESSPDSIEDDGMEHDESGPSESPPPPPPPPETEESEEERRRRARRLFFGG